MRWRAAFSTVAAGQVGAWHKNGPQQWASAETIEIVKINCGAAMKKLRPPRNQSGSRALRLQDVRHPACRSV
jgi:hypothetical protein